MNFCIPYLKLCCQVLYITPSCAASISFPISKNSDFSNSPIGTNVNGVAVNMDSGCSVSNSLSSLMVSHESSSVSSLSNPIINVNAGIQLFSLSVFTPSFTTQCHSSGLYGESFLSAYLPLNLNLHVSNPHCIPIFLVGLALMI